MEKTVAKFIVPDWGDKVRVVVPPGYIGWRAGNDNPIPESTISPSKGL
jgi:hypothetical protein